MYKLMKKSALKSLLGPKRVHLKVCLGRERKERKEGKDRLSKAFLSLLCSNEQAVFHRDLGRTKLQLHALLEALFLKKLDSALVDQTLTSDTQPLTCTALVVVDLV